MKNPFKFLMLFLAFGAMMISITSCKQAASTEAAAAPDMAQLKTDIQAMENAFEANMTAGDAAAVAAYYAGDALSLDNNGPMLSGKEAITANIAKNIAESGKNKTSFEVVDVKASGDLLVEVGKSTTVDSTGAVVRTGKYLSVFEKRDGKYVCIRDAYNDDAKK
ncbi:MAG: DUF4440 domain-containing protein [Saprospiraceae bacterium]|nr:DUF4440 domain-containing protein [Saprospiraceae bacterium]MBL0024433.1 DUF4440 domain-containing protein [Saprospiraceae bacterium]